MTSSRPDPRLGTTLGPYRIEAVIGRGGMGVVYLATQANLGRKVALKVLAPDLVDEEAFRQRFVRESQMAAAIEHPNILPIYEAGEIDGIYFLAMRYVDGADLETRLRDGQLQPRETVQLLAQVASALDAAGEVSLVHRDVKPANILIASGKGMERADHAYLTDFGLTKHRGSQTGLTRSGAFMGTLDYIAPEQVEGQPVDGRTDQYSLACVAFHCLTGATPFVRDTDIAIAMAHLRDAPPQATTVRPELPSDVDAVLARGMAKAPGDRYPSSEAFVGALKEALGVSATGPHAIPSASRDRRPIVIVAVAATALLVASVAIVASFGGRSPSSPDGQTAGAPSGAADLGSPTGGASSPTPSATEPFTLLESSLILSLPKDSAPECVRGDDALLPTRQGPSMKPRAHVTCRLIGGAGPDSIDAWLMPFMSDLRGLDVISAMAVAAGVTSGDCATGAQGVGGWDIPDTPMYGAFGCWPTADGTGSQLAWSVDESWVVYQATVTGGDHADLNDWWIANRESITP